MIAGETFPLVSMGAVLCPSWNLTAAMLSIADEELEVM
jgi:hypothetical protein